MTRKYFPMQPWLTMKGATVYTSALVQPQDRCPDGQEADQVSLAIQVLGNTVASGTTLCDLVIQSSLVPEGPWETLSTITAASTVVRQYYTSDEEGTNRFQRFLRWKLDPSGCIDDWTMTFKVDGVMK